MRLDLYLVEKSFFSTRQKAKYAIEDGFILVNNQIITKAGYDVKDNDYIEVKERKENYVSRGGYKLSKALKEFNIDVKDKICLDIGQSTGGFSDCLYQNKAKYILGIEVGYNQLDKSLLENDVIHTIEKKNFKDLTKEEVNNTMFDIVCIDVSFISLTKIMSNLINFVNNNTKIIALIKPQFELYEQAIKHKGYINSKEDHILAITNVIQTANNYGLFVYNLTYSPILGEKKENIEFLIELSLIKTSKNISIEEIVNEAHKILR